MQAMPPEYHAVQPVLPYRIQPGNHLTMITQDLQSLIDCRAVRGNDDETSSDSRIGYAWMSQPLRYRFLI